MDRTLLDLTREQITKNMMDMLDQSSAMVAEVMEDCAREEEREDILRMLRRDECDVILSNPELHAYIVMLSQRIEREEHR